MRWPLYGISLVLLVAVFVLAEEVRGSKRWIQIGFFNFQPSELGKIALVILLAGFVADRRHRIAEWSTTLGIIGLAAPLMVLVFKEPDFGTTLIYAAIVIGALFFGGTPLAAPGRPRRCRRPDRGRAPVVPSLGRDRGARAVPA